MSVAVHVGQQWERARIAAGRRHERHGATAAANRAPDTGFRERTPGVRRHGGRFYRCRPGGLCARRRGWTTPDRFRSYDDRLPAHRGAPVGTL